MFLLLLCCAVLCCAEEMSIPFRELIERHCGGVKGGWDNLQVCVCVCVFVPFWAGVECLVGCINRSLIGFLPPPGLHPRWLQCTPDERGDLPGRAVSSRAAAAAAAAAATTLLPFHSFTNI